MSSSEWVPTLLIVWNLITNMASGEFSAIIMIRSRKEEFLLTGAWDLATGDVNEQGA